jgi:hypothetical protein
MEQSIKPKDKFDKRDHHCGGGGNCLLKSTGLQAGGEHIYLTTFMLQHI